MAERDKGALNDKHRLGEVLNQDLVEESYGNLLHDCELGSILLAT